ncbi:MULTISPECIES: IS1634 family transposase [Actinomycetes]|uniref:DDE family transposase n=2 Tax=Humibacillus xanthopallidus TaxID=412689 RepID=A0A543PQF1_9MICO|nr:IS1634 family transposase [Humibacillus xanthopallidus]TQN45185.1 DDE family transposase [Humibacillus xanthopallidus]TQN46282.1 DDE family transposase [Humibacillus xanthopallidus]TQN46302.1 DDE family transposase [Humibacillus xanthopallidus]TQN47719.1 IS4 family transposase [Humibacillus xanthopallidus]TQN48815.1 DDE family transposase [Humibacillus xanthopallidus]
MVFVRKVRTASGATAVQIAERLDGRDRVLEHLGSAHTEAELAALVAAARRKVYPGQGELDLSAGAVPAGHAVITSKSSAVLWQVLAGAYTRLGFDAIDDVAFQQLVLARIIEPTSKADSLRVLEEVGVAHASLRTMFRSLARAQERGYRDVLAGACFTHATASGDVSLCLYDVTTLYFEAENEDELRKVGYSKERRVDPQIVVGLLVDRGGFPLEIGCWEGNTAETTTMIPIIRQFQQRHSLSDMVVVADAGMLSASNLRDLDSAGLRFIVGSRVTKAPADLASHFRWHGDAFTDGQVIDTITPRVATTAARGVNDVNKKTEPTWDPAVHDRSWRAVWAYSRKRAARDGKTLTLQENRARAVVAGEKAARTPRFVTTKHGTQSLDEASLARARRLAGLKGYVTNIPADVMPAGEVIASYHDLWQVEASFRMSKSDLRARPIFHHTRESIEAHLTIVFAALAVARYLQDATGMSIKKLVRTLRPLQLMTLTIAGHEHTAADPLTDTGRDIIIATGTNWPTH